MPEATCDHDRLRSGWADAICHPVPLAAALVLALNDHWLKGSGLLPAWLAGKLSDVAGLFVFAVLCFAAVAGVHALAGRRPRRPRAWILGIVLLTALGFWLANASPAFDEWLARVWGPKTPDPTDLFTLPVLLPAWMWIEHRHARRPTRQAA